MISQQWIESLAAASIQGGIFILVVAAVCVAFKRLPPWVRAGLWTIACAQMLFRLCFSVPIPVASDASKESPAEPVISIQPETPVQVAPITWTEPPKREPTTQPVSLESVLASLWIAGFAVGLGVAGRRLLGAYRLVRTAEPLSSLPALQILESLLESKELRPRLLKSGRVKSPLLAGYLRPTIVVPEGFAESHSPEEIRMALAHEISHIRRSDQWLALVAAITQTVFFFHPLVWLAFREAALAREEACDIDVLRMCGETPAAYAHFLVKSAQARTPVAALGAAYGYRSLRRRITMIKRSNLVSKSSLRRTWLAVVAAAVAASLPWTVVAQPVDQKKHPVHVKTKRTKVAKKRESVPAFIISAAAPAKVRDGMLAPAKGAKVAISPSAAAGPVPASSTDMAAIPASAIKLPPLQEKRAEAGRSNPSNPSNSGQKPAADAATTWKTPAAVKVRDRADNARSAAERADIDVNMNSSANPMQREVTMRLVNADAYQSLVDLLTSSGVDFVIKAKIHPQLVTCRITKRITTDALAMLLSGMQQNLSYRIEGTVIYIVDGE